MLSKPDARGARLQAAHTTPNTTGDGFCTFNGIALAAKRALRAGVKRVLIIDSDAHCGGGTHSLIEDDDRIRQLDIAVNSYDHYTPHAPNTLDLVHSAAEYLGELSNLLAELVRTRERFELCIYYAGMDPFERCHIGGLSGVNRAMLAEREQLVFSWCREQRIPVAFGIGGGYINFGFKRDELVDLHRLTLHAAVAGDQQQ
ncbi:MAG: hypothetical protein H0V62_15075 [Gammaproteobacteria bacterium]|nr:hypothetical protein [Gammaproteobacteria bacterium]MBA3732248.1 hypothetical protein [Gammaproteobacteria bacterium]